MRRERHSYAAMRRPIEAAVGMMLEPEKADGASSDARWRFAKAHFRLLHFGLLMDQDLAAPGLFPYKLQNKDRI